MTDKSHVVIGRKQRLAAKSKSPDVINVERWREKKITLTQLVDRRGNPMTITQLEERIKN